MSDRLSRALARVLPAALLLLASSCAGPKPSSPHIIVASIGPLGDWTAHVAGPSWRVLCVLPPGASEHAYDLRPADAARFEHAQLWIQVGGGLDPFMKILENTATSPRVIDLSSRMRLVDGNPHIWLDPSIARASLERIAAALIRLDPADSAGYEKRASAYGASLDSVDAEYRAAALHFRVRDFVAFHDAWGYLARRYGMRQVGSVEAAPGREPGPADWGRLVEVLKSTHSRALFAEPQFAAHVPEALARDAGVRVLRVDPLGTTGSPGGESYVDLMRRNLAVFKEGLQ